MILQTFPMVSIWKVHEDMMFLRVLSFSCLYDCRVVEGFRTLHQCLEFLNMRSKIPTQQGLNMICLLDCWTHRLSFSTFLKCLHLFLNIANKGLSLHFVSLHLHHVCLFLSLHNMCLPSFPPHIWSSSTEGFACFGCAQTEREDSDPLPEANRTKTFKS